MPLRSRIPFHQPVQLYPATGTSTSLIRSKTEIRSDWVFAPPSTSISNQIFLSVERINRSIPTRSWPRSAVTRQIRYYTPRGNIALHDASETPNDGTSSWTAFGYDRNGVPIRALAHPY